MMLRMLTLAVAILTWNAGAAQQSAASDSPTAVDAARPIGIPAADALTLAKPADMQAAAQFASDPALQLAVNAYLRGSAQRWKLVAARELGDYVLLWISFSGVADGGVDLVYSKKQRRIGWEFLGGYRG